MPRTIDIVLRGEIVETAKPGQMVNFSGTLIVVPDVAQMNSVGDRSEVVREAGARRSPKILVPQNPQLLTFLSVHSALTKALSACAL
jgi:DNA replicative helicase MCM subunit Mcm2 (Cdc46/Mcm family)